MMLDAFLLAMAAIGITGKAAVLIVPNIAIKILLLLIMLFIGCVSIDTFHAHYLKETAGIVSEAEVVSQSPVSLWRTVVHAYPSLPLWTIAFILIICIEIRLFFCAWYRIAFGNGDGDEKEVERHPPSYAYCISHAAPNVCAVDELPSYEEAIRRSSLQKPCCSKSLLPPRSAQPSCSSTSKAAAAAQSAARSQSSSNPKAQLKAQVQRYLKTTSSATSSQPRPQRVVAIQIEQPRSETEQRCEWSFPC
ncbi:hypothetical protein ANCDUO_03888 [Ancylostoma duodenale]|uniref:Uncharacterized protein n=1 Tax=Ancylostoma duodenale TaxID=51022 RepID=A0A0C2H8E3_9BILA|nr:hypothetical protein ANCDUO_03888 [Ancylostoma duodenale]